MRRNDQTLSLLLAAVLLSAFVPAAGVVMAGEEKETGESAAGVETQDDEGKESGDAAAADEAQETKEEAEGQTGEKKEKSAGGVKEISGMSILGNQEAPKSLVLIPWKSSELGASLGISPLLDDSRQPVDKEVFLRALIYYEIRAGKAP